MQIIFTSRYSDDVCVVVCLCVAVMRDEFREEPGDVELAAGHEATLRCRPPRAEPAPVVSWTRDGAALPLDVDRVYVDDTGSLHVLDARRDDSGLYECVAENVAGRRHSAPARLTVRGDHLASLSSSSSSFVEQFVLHLLGRGSMSK